MFFFLQIKLARPLKDTSGPRSFGIFSPRRWMARSSPCPYSRPSTSSLGWECSPSSGPYPLSPAAAFTDPLSFAWLFYRSRRWRQYWCTNLQTLQSTTWLVWGCISGHTVKERLVLYFETSIIFFHFSLANMNVFLDCLCNTLDATPANYEGITGVKGMETHLSYSLSSHCVSPAPPLSVFTSSTSWRGATGALISRLRPPTPLSTSARSHVYTKTLVLCILRMKRNVFIY